MTPDERIHTLLCYVLHVARCCCSQPPHDCFIALLLPTDSHLAIDANVVEHA